MSHEASCSELSDTLLWGREKELRKEPDEEERNTNDLFRGCAFSTSFNVHTVTALWVKYQKNIHELPQCTHFKTIPVLCCIRMRWGFFLKKPKNWGFTKKHFCITSDTVHLAVLFMSPGRRGHKVSHIISFLANPWGFQEGDISLFSTLKKKEIWISGFGSVGHFNT